MSRTRFGVVAVLVNMAVFTLLVFSVFGTAYIAYTLAGLAFGVFLLVMVIVKNRRAAPFFAMYSLAFHAIGGEH